MALDPENSLKFSKSIFSILLSRKLFLVFYFNIVLEIIFSIVKYIIYHIIRSLISFISFIYRVFFLMSPKKYLKKIIYIYISDRCCYDYNNTVVRVRKSSVFWTFVRPLCWRFNLKNLHFYRYTYLILDFFFFCKYLIDFLPFSLGSLDTSVCLKRISP